MLNSEREKKINHNGKKNRKEKQFYFDERNTINCLPFFLSLSQFKHNN